MYRFFGDEVLRAPMGAPAPKAEPRAQGREAFFWIDGMHCASCALLIEHALAAVEGVLSAASSYATATAKVVFDPAVIDEARLRETFARAGYRARPRAESVPGIDARASLLRLVIGVALAALVMMLYLAFFYPVHLGVVDPADLAPVDWLAFGAVPRIVLLLTTVVVFYVGLPILRGAWAGLRVGALNMDHLLAIAILAAWGYSVGQLAVGSLDLYFDVAAVIVIVVTLGRYLEQGARADATAGLTGAMAAWPPMVRVRRGGTFQDCGLDELAPGDRVVVRQAERIPVDGTVVHGQGAVDESLMTGEPFPVTRGPGEAVLGGTVAVDGTLEIDVGPAVTSRMGDLARVLWNLQSATAGVPHLADRLARVFVPMVLVLALAVGEWTLLGGAAPSAAFLTALATLIVSCPCTFGLAIPLSAAVGTGAGMRRGIIVKRARAFEKGARADICVIDKTGILSSAEVGVVRVAGHAAVAERAAAVERLSSHPIARAIARLDSSRTAADAEVHPGRGVVATVAGRRVAVGSRSLFALLSWRIPRRIAAVAAGVPTGAGVVSYVGWGGRARGAIVTADRPRPDWKQAVKRLRAACRVVLMTGAEHPGEYASQVDEVHAGVPPEGKAAVIRRLRCQGTVVMIGDGSNDAPALAAADLGVAFGSPAALAVDAADVVIMGDDLGLIFDAFDLIDTTRRRIRQNLGWALSYNAVAIPLALAGLMNPLFAAVAMATSSLLVVWNASRPLRATDQSACSSRSSALAHQSTDHPASYSAHTVVPSRMVRK